MNSLQRRKIRYYSRKAFYLASEFVATVMIFAIGYIVLIIF